MSSIITFILYSILIFGSATIMNKSVLTQNKYLIYISGILVTIILAVFAALRVNAGTDTAMYRYAYENGANHVFRWVDFESGYLMIMNILHYFDCSSNTLFFIMNFFTCGFIIMSIIIERNNINVFVAMIIFISNFYFYSFNALRQTFAASICFFAMCIFFKTDYNYQRILTLSSNLKIELNLRKILSFVLILFATCFHTSASICLFLFIGNIFFNEKNTFKLLIISFIVLTLLMFNRDILANIVLKLTGSGYYANYISRDAASDGSFITYYIKNMPSILISTLCLKNFNTSKERLYMYALMIIGIILASIGSVTATFVNRIGLYFSCLNIIVLSYCCKNDICIKTFAQNKLKITSGILSVITVLYFYALFIYNVFYRGFNQLVPYGNL